MQTEWRVACVRIPRFPIGAVQRARRLGGSLTKGDVQLLLPMEDTTGGCSSPADAPGEPHWDDTPIVLTDGAPTRPRLRGVTAAAARHGVRAGMSLSEARALCANVEAWPWDDAAVSAAITAATAMFVETSPQVSPVSGAPGMWWIGASGFAAGVRGAGDGGCGGVGGGGEERAFAHALLAIARRWHPQARVAIADTCVAARAATWASAAGAAGAEGTRGGRQLVTIVPAGRDAAYLDAAPLALLPMDDEMRDALRALGIRSVGQLAALDAGDVEQRWGDLGLAAWRLARGDDPRRPVLARFDEPPHVAMELDTPSATMEPVLFLVRPGVERLVEALVAQGRAIASLSITLTLDDARGALPDAQPHTVTREIRLPRPLARPAPLFERCRGLLARWPLTAPVTAVRLAVLLTSPLTGEQGNLLNTSWKDPGAADAALERVRAELGPGVVVQPAMRDAHAPERSGAWHEAGDTAPEAGRRASDARPQPATAVPTAPGMPPSLRLLADPEKVDVDRDPDPRRIFWRGRALTIASVVGPERLSGDWWTDGYSRDYWRCESDDEHGELVLYRDAAGWWVQGWYD